MDDSDDITLLVRKIAKCERLLKKPPVAPGRSGASSTSKLQKKRSEYIMQLGELAYRAALESPMMLVAGPSPTTVTEKLDSSNFAQFHDSLAIFEHPSMLTGQESDDTPPDEYNPALLAVEDTTEDQERDEEEPQVKMAAIVNPSSDPPAAHDEIAFENSSEMYQGDNLQSSAVDERCDETDVPQSFADSDKVVNLETLKNQEDTTDLPIEQETQTNGLAESEEVILQDQELDESENPDNLSATEGDLAETLDTEVPDDESLDILQSTTEADKRKQEEVPVEEATTTAPSEHITTTEINEPQIPKTSDVDPAHDEENSNLPDSTPADLDDPNSTHSGETNLSEPRAADPVEIISPSTSSAKGSDFDGEGSVSKLRAMFDSPTGEKPRRSWRPKRVYDAVPPAPLATAEDATPTQLVPTTVTMRVQEGSDQPQAVITLRQAVMTSSVHDIDSPLVALVSLFPESLHAYLQKQNRALLIFNALGIEPQYVDGSNPAERERRDELFRLSGKRGEYPQLFVRKQGKLEFFADFDRIELLNDCDTLKEELEAACR